MITYDRRGCARSERPVPYERTSVAEQTAAGAELIEALAAAPAVVIGRSYGRHDGADLAIRYPELVRALVLLEPDASRELAPAAVAWVEPVTRRLRLPPTSASTPWRRR